MKDRLTKLILQSDILCDSCGENAPSHCAEALADYLLKRGVSVPLCGIGEKVYAMYDISNYDFNGKQRQRNCMITSLGSKRKPARSNYGFLYDITRIEIREIDYRKCYENLIGKTIFLTREEAEQVLKSR